MSNEGHHVSLYCANRIFGWHPYDIIRPSADRRELMLEICSGKWIGRWVYT